MLIWRARRRAALSLIRLVQAVRIACYSVLSTGRHVGCPRKLQPLFVAGKGRVSFEEEVQIGVFPSPHFLSTYAYFEARDETASIHIGGGTVINNGFCCIAHRESIKIGNNCLIGANVEVLDSDFHELRAELRKAGHGKIGTGGVCIGDDVFVGSNVRILKGVSIGAGSVIANSSVVVGSIPPGVVAAGFPAKVIREL